MIKRPSLLTIFTICGFIFLYGPIVILVIYSFNKSKLVSVWAGFSTQWYGKLLENDQIINAAIISFKIAFTSASLSLILGTMLAFILTRFGAFRGRNLLTMMGSAPLIMPEVITGLSLLLLFVTLETIIGWPSGRGMITIIIAHTSFGLAYVAVIIQAKLSQFDRTIEEAAHDLGAKPWRVFYDITLPLIAPSMIASWLLAFTLSLDDLVIASFVSGPGASTLPMVIFSKVRLGVSPEINALATLLILTVAISVTIAMICAMRKPKI